ncbi:acyltransferase family protein [Saccharopolyspora sp. WRP15-2]|uniref:Acyltransferase family protein n=1 Tax=Saccharopolyspora oryzae TaxID=2997343 RepID=A0ABT4UWV7_9PSEU|nr:acyltransferase family protein [Saccharopolyspora oryzae]MDA3626190.1 acyltransferase family protein [Saccharopolyspora oryzae]
MQRIPAENRTGDAKRRYARGLDGLRALAVLMVVVYHGNEEWLPGGFLGVDVFFVISGYLITDQLCARWQQEGSLDLATFWVRRVRRLVPAVLVVLAVATAAATIVKPALLSGIGGELLAAVTFTSNWWGVASGASYFSQFGDQSLLLHLWSLAVEEQFYLVWPLVLLVVLRLVRRRSARACIAFAMACASAIAMIVLHDPGADASRVYYGTDTHAFGLLLGASLAIAMPSQWLVGLKRPGASVLSLLGSAGAVVLAFMAVLLGGSSEFLYSGGFGLVAVVAGAVVVAAIPAAGWFGRLLSWQPLRWIGLRSYGIYLWHMPVVVLFSASGVAVSDALFVGLVAAVSLAVAGVSYRWVEEPFRRNGIRATIRRLTAPSRTGETRTGPAVLTGAVVVVLLLAVTGVVLAPPKNDLQSQIAAGEDAAEATPKNPSPPPPAAPSTDLPAIQGTQVPAIEERRAPGTGVTAFGDSVMAAAGTALRERLPGANLDLKIGRQMWDLPELIASERDSGRLGSVVVVGLGTNGDFNTSTLERAIWEAGPQRAVVLINISVPKDWQDRVNAKLADADARWPNVTVVDWRTAARNHPGAFWDDGTHPRNPNGTDLYADLVVDALPPQVK